jgi:hypothetical protein
MLTVLISPLHSQSYAAGSRVRAIYRLGEAQSRLCAKKWKIGKFGKIMGNE